MYRSLFVLLIAAALSTGCEQPQMQMGPPQKPEPAPELAKLGLLVGTWTGTAEMIEPSLEDMKKSMPEGAPEPCSTFEGSFTSEWTLGGMFLHTEGWHEMGPDQRMNFQEYYTWDPKAKKYRTYFFSDYGEYGQGWMTLDAGGKHWRIEAKGVDATGAVSQGKGTMTFTDDNTVDWTWSESGPKGKMKFKGTSKRKG